MNKRESLIQENLVGLYLRLNGYFQTGYIPHSSVPGQIGTDLDRFAVRFPKHSQPERKVDACPLLRIPDDTIDIIIAEVKNSAIHFNASIKSGGSRTQEIWEQILRWCGLFEGTEIKNLSPQLISIVDKDGDAKNGSFEHVVTSNTFGTISIRPIIFSIESNHDDDSNKIWINGDDMIQYIWKCLCPDAPVDTCATTYPLENWGTEYFDLVSIFKGRKAIGAGEPTMADLYNPHN